MQATELAAQIGIEQLEARLRAQLVGRVRDFHLRSTPLGLVLEGWAKTYYSKQVAQQMVMESSPMPIAQNAIEVG